MLYWEPTTTARKELGTPLESRVEAKLPATWKTEDLRFLKGVAYGLRVAGNELDADIVDRLIGYVEALGSVTVTKG